MLRRYRKIKEDSRFIAAEIEDDTLSKGGKHSSFISFYLLLTSSIYKA